MAFPRNSLRAFLQHAKTNLVKAIQEEHPINIVVGNESAGLLTYALVDVARATLTSIRPRFTNILSSLRLHQIYLSSTKLLLVHLCSFVEPPCFGSPPPS